MQPVLAFGLTDESAQLLRWVLAALIIVGGLLVLGIKDLLRFSATRVWAISSVCFTEAMRKRIYLVVPLAIVAVIAVSQLTRPTDEQDAIRQTTKFCLFAAGLVVTVICIILACTNLPKEIENRVIFTVVTKPTTRLEIVLGKIVGFARVSGLILLVLGIFTYGYLKIRASLLQRDIVARLHSGLVEDLARPTLEHYASVGLLNSKGLQDPSDVQFYARNPKREDRLRWFSGSGEQDVLFAFDINEAELLAAGTDIKSTGMLIGAKIALHQFRPSSPEWQEMVPVPASQPASLQSGPSTAPSALPQMALRPLPQPMVTFNIMGRDRFLAVDGSKINGNLNLPLPLTPSPDTSIIQGFVSPEDVVDKILPQGRIYVQVTSPSQGTEWGIEPDSVKLYVPGPEGKPLTEIRPAGPPTFRGRSGTYGLQLRGASNAETAPVSIVHFRDANFAEVDGNVPFELRFGIERSGADATDSDIATNVSITVKNSDGKLSEPIPVKPENNRTSFVNIPAAYLAGGSFDLIIRCLTTDHWLGITSQSVSVVSQSQPFAFNLFKSLFILWLLSILVIIIAVFCSTFLSWPIAVVLSLVILLGHWGVMQLGDATAPGIGNQVVTDMKLTNAASSKAVSSSVEALAKSLNFFATILPDINQYSATEDIERGMIVSADRLKSASAVTLGFGIPMAVLAYVLLKRKEVAP